MFSKITFNSFWQQFDLISAIVIWVGLTMAGGASNFGSSEFYFAIPAAIVSFVILASDKES